MIDYLKLKLSMIKVGLISTHRFRDQFIKALEEFEPP